MAPSKGSKEPKVIQNPLSFYSLIEGPKVDGPLLGGNLPFDPDGMKREMDRVFLPKRVRKQEQELAEAKAKMASLEAANEKKIARLADQLKALKRTRSSRGRCPLWQAVATVKHKNPKIASDHAAIALRVDEMLAKKGWVFKDACPPPWRKTPGLPRTFSEARMLSPWKGRAKTLISQAI